MTPAFTLRALQDIPSTIEVPPRSPKKLRRPNWLALRGVGESAAVAREAPATEMDRRVALGQFWGKNLSRIPALG